MDMRYKLRANGQTYHIHATFQLERDALIERGKLGQENAIVLPSLMLKDHWVVWERENG